MATETLVYTASLDPGVLDRRREELLVAGAIVDPDMESRILRLQERFRVFCACCHCPAWAPGLVITREVRALHEVYLPVEEIRSAFRRFTRLALRHPPFHPASLFHASPTWVDILHHLQPFVPGPDPGRLLRVLMNDADERSRFLFAQFLPRRYGGGFDRYPRQRQYLQDWVRHRRLQGKVRCLDAACGSGEGTYELARLLLRHGVAVEQIEVRGVTIDPLELFAAAHAWFPHDPARQEAYRAFIRKSFPVGTPTITFSRGDLRTGEGEGSAGRYDIVLCNGLLGGPLLHEREHLAATIRRLCSMIHPGGILMAADHFHEGWKRAVPAERVRRVLAEEGLAVLSVEQGIAGVKVA